MPAGCRGEACMRLDPGAIPLLPDSAEKLVWVWRLGTGTSGPAVKDQFVAPC